MSRSSLARENMKQPPWGLTGGGATGRGPKMGGTASGGVEVGAVVSAARASLEAIVSLAGLDRL